MSETKAIQKRLDINQHKQRGEKDIARLFRMKMENCQIRQAAKLLEKEGSGGILSIMKRPLGK